LTQRWPLPRGGPTPAATMGSAGPAEVPGAALGREAELRTLHGWLAQAQRGERCVGFVTGEAGIGKTTLVDTFVAQAAAAGALWLGRGQCVEQYGAGEAYLPVLEALGQLCRGPESGRLLALLEQQAPLWLLQLPTVLGASAREALQRQVQGASSARMLREFAEAVEALTAIRPLVLVLEDLHWSDRATLALVAYLAQRRAPARLLLLGTYRPVEVIVHGHPLQAVKTALTLHGHCVELVLEVLPAAAVAAVVAARVPGHALPPAMVAALHRRTDGHPLFLVQLVDGLLRQGVLVEVGGRWALAAGLAAIEATVPESLRQLIEQQFDGLSAAQQQVLEAASVAGLAGAVAAVAAGVAADAEQVEVWCAELARQGQFVQAGALVVWPDGTVGGSYQFRHALYQQVVYDRVPVGRRVRLHQRIGLRVEAGYGARAGERAAELAMHFERGHDYPRAVRYLQQAADNALQRYAFQEASRHLRQGLEFLQTLPDTPERAQQELAMQLTLGQVSVVTLGQAAAAVEQAYTRAQALCQQLGDPPQLAGVLAGLRRVSLARGELQRARALGEQLLRLGQCAADPAVLLEGHYALGVTCFWLGEMVHARAHLEQSLTLGTAQPLHFQSFAGGPVQGRVILLGYMAWSLWVLGYPAQALRQSQAALTLARESAHAYGLVFALSFAASVHWFRRETQLAHACTAAALSLARQQEFPLSAAGGTILQGWALVEQGHVAAGLVQMRQGLAAWHATQTETQRPYWLALLAAAYGTAGQATEGLGALAEALTLVAHTGERWWEAELYRLQGELSLQSRVQSPGSPLRPPPAAFRIRKRRRPAFSRPSPWPAASRPSPWSYAPP
jgi:predicted ATPase